MSKQSQRESPAGLAEPSSRPTGVGKGSSSAKGAAGPSGSESSLLSRPPAKPLLDKVVSFFASLRLTVTLLAIGMVLVFTGTLAQVDLGLYKAQNEFFRSLIVYWGPKGATWRIPVLPGGYLVGGLLLINLLTAHFKRFQFSKKKIGIWMVHFGLILLLLGQLLTDMLSRETHMWLSEGQSKNYSDSSMHDELAVIDTSNQDYDEVVAFPERMVARKGELRHPRLPFTIRVKEFFVNSNPRVRAPRAARDAPQASQGIADRIEFSELPPTAASDSRNIPAAIVEVTTKADSLGSWVVSDWLVEEKLIQILQSGFREQLGKDLGASLGRSLIQPQQFTFQGHTYQIALRPVRSYKPFSLQLLKFSHDRYRGTDVPKNFSSRVRLTRPDTGEDREVLIYMNTPLRYAGETFYQGGFDEVDPRVTILQVVHNPSWLTPYLACLLVGGGLVVQFLTHLTGFVRKRRKA